MTNTDMEKAATTRISRDPNMYDCLTKEDLDRVYRIMGGTDSVYSEQIDQMRYLMDIIPDEAKSAIAKLEKDQKEHQDDMQYVHELLLSKS